jgi:solute carrier family 9 (sodium/hydrogen exchanger), member 6/7
VYTFKQSIFFDFFLPPIIFNSGFNMRRKKFFMNIGNIMIFGLFVTLVCFTIYSVSSQLVLDHMGLEMT